MKTIIEWLEELPEPYMSEAIINYNSSEWDKECPYGNLADALLYAFHWGNSWQGHEYWLNLMDRSKSGEFKEPKTKDLFTKYWEIKNDKAVIHLTSVDYTTF